MRVNLDVSIYQNGVGLGLLPLQGVDVVLVVVQGPRELLKHGIAVGELDLGPELGLRYLLLP